MTTNKKLLRQQASLLTDPIIDQYKLGLKAGTFPNPIRAMEHCGTEMTRTLAKKGFSSFLFPLMATIGDVDAVTFSRRLSLDERKEFGGEFDPFESDFTTLAYEMGFGNEGFANVQKEEVQIVSNYKQRGINIFRYDTFARGTIEARELFANQARSIGLDGVTHENTWIVEGGMGGLKRVYENINDNLREILNRRARFLAPSVVFTMGVVSAKKVGLQIDRISVNDLPNQELTGERSKQYFEQGGTIPDILYLVLADNPRAMSANPEVLRKVLRVALKANPNTVFAFDMAYMKLIPQDRAKTIMAVIKESGADQRGYFVFSDSKRIARPGSRYGAVVIPNKQFRDSFQDYTMAVSPGYSADSDVRYQALIALIDDKIVDRYQKLLRRRQKALLEVLMELDPNQKFFRNLDKIQIEGYYDRNKLKEGDIVQDVPLYIWVEINNEKQDYVEKCFDIIKKLNIIGVPGAAFGDENHMRFSLGVVSTIDILKKSPAVLNRWLEKLDSKKQ